MKYFFLFSFVFLVSCRSQYYYPKDSGVGIPMKTANKYTPYIYKKGFLNHNIVKTSIQLNKTDSLIVNELKFNSVYSASYTEKIMFDNFGKWNREIYVGNSIYPVLVWNNVDLLSNKTLYDVYVYGVESKKEIYASAIVIDKDGKDYLNEDAKEKQKIINFFSNEIINLSDDDKFYEVYSKSIKE